MPTQEQLRALQAVVRAVVDTVREAGPEGAPAGIVYAALMTQGCRKAQFDSLIDALVRAGKLTRSGDMLVAT